MEEQDQKVWIDLPPVSRNEAVSLLFYHLCVAAACYEATRGKLESLLDHASSLDEEALIGATAFITALDAHFSGLPLE